MGKKKVLLKSEDKRSLVEVAKFLRDLADKVETNDLILSQGKKKIEVPFPDIVALEFELKENKKKKKGTKRQLEIEIEWYPDGKNQETIQVG
ncbi:MAG: amphi-Trp domain-containing protein [Chloroflexota bacterium]|nr:amphi-Trp domain-containing protein [Chloroflexota bacterium]